MAASEQPSTLDRLEERPLRWQIRFYAERLAFTQRGRFAFLVGTLLVMFKRVEIIATEGVPSASRPIPASPDFVSSMWMAGEVALTILVVTVAGMVVLLVMDIYEDEIGVLPEVSDGDN